MIVLDIIEGYLKEANNKSLSQEDKDLAASRLEICMACPLYTDGTCDTGGMIKNVKTNKPVRGCGCTLKYKVFCKTCNCPANKW